MPLLSAFTLGADAGQPGAVGKRRISESQWGKALSDYYIPGINFCLFFPSHG
tara:strand:- start:33898 stop:34053 length:156 start_codon:yes stop_codon:yes gene_type:complete